ncbi:MAG: GTP-binding protein [Chloroflexota bacterium]
MELHLVNGFLGSGKTTAIIAAARQSMQAGKTVGIVTNDKGQFQVDAAFFQANRIPTRQVTGGCFRCSFSEFEEKIAELQAAASPDAVFAESVGSCVDLVDTIFGPLQRNHHLSVERTTYSVFADIRLFWRWLCSEPLPFSDAINYLFEKQIEEGNLLVLNKADLLHSGRKQEVLAAARERFAQKTILLQNSLEQAGPLPWLAVLGRDATCENHAGFSIDYRRYKSGEQEMAWYDQAFTLEAADPHSLKPAAVEMIGLFLAALQRMNAFVGHVKFFVSNGGVGCKLSFTTADFFEDARPSAWAEALPDGPGVSLSLVLNARLAMDGAAFAQIVQDIRDRMALFPQIHVRAGPGTAVHPDMSLARPA